MISDSQGTTRAPAHGLSIPQKLREPGQKGWGGRERRKQKKAENIKEREDGGSPGENSEKSRN